MFQSEHCSLIEYYRSSLCRITCICKCTGFQFCQRMIWLTMRKFLKLCVDDTRFMGFNVSTSDSARKEQSTVYSGEPKFVILRPSERKTEDFP